MTELLLRIFVKGYPNCNCTSVRSSIGTFAGVVGIVCNVILFLGKFLIGILSGSVAVIADAVNNFSDAFSSVVTLLGFRMAQKPADAEHPFGHARYEYIAGLVVAALILVIGFELILSSVKKIFAPVAVDFTWVALIVLLLSVLVKLWMAVFFRTLGKKIRSTTLMATSADSRNDVIASLAVLIGCVLEFFFGFPMDGYFGVAVALFILYSGVGIAKETISPLLGGRADAELVKDLGVLVSSHPKILGIHDLLVHDYGPGQCFATVHAEMSAEEDPLECHDIIDDIESEALEKLNVHLVIHYDPVVINDAEWDEMRSLVESAVRDIDAVFSVHDFRIVRGASRPKLVFDVAVPYSMCDCHNDLRKQINNALIRQEKDYITVIRIDHTE